MSTTMSASQKKPVALWVIVVALLVAGAVLLYRVQNLNQDLGHSSEAKPAPTAPIKATNGAPPASAPVVQVASLRDAINKADWAGLKGELAKGVDVNAQMQLVEGSRRQMTLLMYTAMQGSADGVKQLLATGADPDGADPTGTTPLMMAAAKGELAVVTMLLDAKARVDTRNRWGQTPLMNAAQAGSAEVIKALLAAGASPKAIDEEGNSPLIKAAGSDASVSAIQDLIKAGAEVDSANAEGVTALMRAAERGDADKVTALLNAGAKVDLKDRDGRKAIEWAQQRSDEAGKRVIDILSAAGGK